MTPTPYVGGRKPRNAKPHSRDRAERTLDEMKELGTRYAARGVEGGAQKAG